MRYHGTVIRPPSEAQSYILQVTYGCSHNRCTFCGTFLDKSFQVRQRAAVFEDIAAAARLMPEVRRVFLADGDALVLSAERLLAILAALRSSFLELERVAIYANARNVLAKSDEELAALRKAGLGIAYLGLESGSAAVLEAVNKGCTPDEMVAAVRRLKTAGIAASVIGILGLAGTDGSAEHADATAEVVRRMDPDYFAMLSLMLVPGTPLHADWQQERFRLPDARGMLAELRRVIDGLHGLSGCVFRTNHASNYLPIHGRLPDDRQAMLQALDWALQQGASILRPEGWRGL